MNSWEYLRTVVEFSKLLRGDGDAEVARLGAEGWELVSTIARERHGYGHEVCLFFKRPMASGRDRT